MKAQIKRTASFKSSVPYRTRGIQELDGASRIS